MKTITTILTFIIVLVLTVYLKGQSDYVVYATNGELVDDYNFEFDIYILSTGTETLELATFQTSIYFNDAIRDSGSLSAEYIKGTSTLSDSNQYPNPPNLTFTSNGDTIRQLRIAPKAPPGAGNGSTVSDIAPGTRFGRFRITNTVAFNNTVLVNWQWNYTTGLKQYSSYINAYIGTTNTNISAPAKFQIDLNDPLFSTTTFQLTVSVTDGWNMVSIPGLNPVDQDVGTWWSGLTGSVFKFSGGYQVVTTAAPSEGYWMKHTGANVYNTGDEWPAGGINIVPNDPISAAAGWNMIGGYENSAAVSGLTTTPPGLISGSVFGYSGGYVTATNLVPGYGYWIKLTGAGLINIPPAPLSKGSGEVVEYIKDDWGKITIIDNAGKSYTLYAVKGEVDLNNYELPPMPPSGIFDIRYGSDRIAEDISRSTQRIDMSGIEHPIKVKVENMDIRLQDETGKEINENLKSGEEITISNNLINKLMVTGEMIPDVYSLEQNYPNPFNPSTVIEFSLPEDVNNVQLTIYDVLGQRVTQLVNTSLQAGRYSYQWNGGTVATGMYIYELRADKFVSVKKMILMK